MCDIGARYHPVEAKPTLQEATGWDPNQLFLGYMNKVREKREEDLKHAEEDALMAMVDAMNVRDRETARGRETAEDILLKASQSISERTEGKLDPDDTLTVQAILACLGDRVSFEQDSAPQRDQERTEEVTQKQPTDPVH
jgi:hypothetical protein